MTPVPEVAVDRVEEETATPAGGTATGPVRLRLDGMDLADYQLDPDLDGRHGPRPYLHPVRTRAGTVVTDALPADHVWHLGASLAVQDVSGTNLWGGRTYVRDVGYTWLHDHGRIRHATWLDRRPDRLTHLLHWQDPIGAVLLTERRHLAALPVPGWDDAWLLEFSYSLTAPPDRDITLGSPATNGRPGGAGYGGFFWRAAASDQPPRIFTDGTEGEETVNGGTAPWVALAGLGPAAVDGGLGPSTADGPAQRPYTLVFTGLTPGDHWFVRAAMYPGVCAAFAFDRPDVIRAGTSRYGRHRVFVMDGHPDRERIVRLPSQAPAGPSVG